MEVLSLPNIFLIISFVIGYTAIILEFFLKVNKTAVALFFGVICWLFFFMGEPGALADNLSYLGHKLSDISEILFFLLGAMTLVELIDSHKGFHTFMHYLHLKEKRRMLWTIAFLSFFLSAILDNLTTTILMISILRKLVPHKKERFLISCMVVVAANAGGAWTPIGDVTTTMLWIGGQISTHKVISEIFIPSLISMLVPLAIFSWNLKGNFPPSEVNFKEVKLEPGAKLVLILGVCAFLFVPLFKWLTGMPPFMGMIISLSVLWLVTDILHHKYEQRQHLRIPHILTRIDVSNILFFLGILLAVDSIEAIGVLDKASSWLSSVVPNESVIATIIGIVSAIVDNVPLVAATMGMYDLSAYPMDADLWMMIAYAAGTGGSLLVMGSSAGVALMGMEKIDFISYVRKMTLPVFAGYIAGMLFYVYVGLR